jgi:hypothetical protein
MNASEPQARHRGYFLTESADAGEPEAGEHESPEGFIFRVRPIRPLRQRVAAARRTATRRHLRGSVNSATDRQARPSPVRTEIGTGSHRPEDLHR